MGELVQDFREVAAGFLLNQQCGHKELHIDNGNTFCQVQQRVLEGQAEVLFVKSCAEFPCNGFWKFMGDHLEPGGKRMAGPDRTAQEINRLGKVSLKVLQAPGSLDRHKGERAESGAQCAQGRNHGVMEKMLK